MHCVSRVKTRLIIKGKSRGECWRTMNFVSVFLILMRIAMWSVSMSYFYADDSSKATVLKRSLTNPGMVSTYIGLFPILTQVAIPEVVLAPIRLLGNCNTPMVMLFVGTFLADFKPHGLLNHDIVGFSFVRLFALPALAWGLGSLLGLSSTARFLFYSNAKSPQPSAQLQTRSSGHLSVHRTVLFGLRHCKPQVSHSPPVHPNYRRNLKRNAQRQSNIPLGEVHGNLLRGQVPYADQLPRAESSRLTLPRQTGQGKKTAYFSGLFPA